MKQKIFIVFGLITAVMGGYLILSPGTAAAATITVNSKADSATNDGVCTLREAITSANSDSVSGAAGGECTAGSGNDTINFNITGTADFTSSGQNGYTIQPTSALPNITTTLTINGFSQPGSDDNDSVSPQPIDAVLLIELDGTNVVGVQNGLNISANSVVVRGLVINNFSSDGVNVAYLNDANNVIVAGCFIGVEPDGTTDAGNVGRGIGDGGSAASNLTIGGLNPADRNIISGNEEGGSSPNTGDSNWSYYGNYMGVARDGITAVPNAQIGGAGAISLDNSDGHIVGGSQTGAANVISGNNSHGLAPFNVNNVTIQGNYIGVGYDGTTSVPNGGAGVTLGGGGSSIIVGGSATDEGNVISNNDGDGVFVNADSDVTVQGNLIENNGQNGIGVSAGTGIVIGGTQTGAGNEVNNSNNQGVSITTASDDVTVQGNSVTDSGLAGISIQASTNIVIGGTQTGAGNDIDNSTQAGIEVRSSSDTVTLQGNIVDSSGSEGIVIDDSANVVVGGSQSGASNTSSNNTQHGINVTGTSSDVIVQSNTASSNGQNGLVTDTSGVTFRNNTSINNTDSGIYLGAVSSGFVYGNTFTGNQSIGVMIDNSSNVVVGSSSTTDRNIISNNQGPGNVVISGFGVNADDNVIQGNYIGTDSNGQVNGSYTQNVGVYLSGSSVSNLIGGDLAGEGNTIAGNSGAGVAVSRLAVPALPAEAVPTNNAILGNNIFENENAGQIRGLTTDGSGIDLLSIELDFPSFASTALESDGVTINDATDSDSGANNYMNFPVIDSATQDGTALTVTLDLDAADTTDPGGNYRVEFFANDSADTTGYGEGQQYLGYANVANGDDQNISVTIPGNIDLTGKVLTATTTSINNLTDSGFGSTSEFSLASNVTVIPQPAENGNGGGGLANTGNSIVVIIVIAIVLIIFSFIFRLFSFF